MKQFSLALSFVLCLLVIGLSACSHDYPEGPSTSVYGARQKITNVWRWEYIYQNGENLTAQYWKHTVTFSDGKVLICDENDNCSEVLWNLPGKGNKSLQLIYLDKDSSILFTIQRLNTNYLSLQYGTRPTDSTYVRWDLTSVKRRYY